MQQNHSNAKMDQVVFSKTTVSDLSNAFKNFKIIQERGQVVVAPLFSKFQKFFEFFPALPLGKIARDFL
ncbi:hypothetical protein [Lactococcus petauri]